MLVSGYIDLSITCTVSYYCYCYIVLVHLLIASLHTFVVMSLGIA